VSGLDVDALVDLTIDAGYGPRSFNAVSANGRARFSIPSARVPGAGLVIIEATSGRSRAVSTMEIKPGEAVSPLDLYLGPRTIEVGSNDVAMVVAVPVDQRGNPVADGTSVDFVHT